MNIFCPNPADQGFKEMIGTFGIDQESYVYNIWNLNNGNPLDYDHKGNPSILFEELLELNNGDREASMKMKATVFNKAFTDFFGEWYKEDYKPTNQDVYENGEPFMDTFLDYTYVKEQESIHKDPVIRANIRKYGADEITDWNNQYVWDIEKEFGLVDETKWRKDPTKKWKSKKLQGFSFNKALSIINKLKERGILAIPEEVHYLTSNVKPRTGVRVKVDIGRPENKAASSARGTGRFTIAGQEFTRIFSDRNPIKKELNKISKQGLNGVTFLENLLITHADLINKNPELKGSIELILNNKHKTPNIQINVKQVNENGDYMDYNPNNHSINLYTETILEDTSMLAFVSSFVHEMGHAFLSDAIDNPSSNADRQFKKTMEEVYAAYLKQENRTNENAALNVDEFMSNFMTDPRLRFQLKEMSVPEFKKSLFQRVLDAIIDWFRLNAGRELRNKHEGNLNDFVNTTITNFINKKTNIRNEKHWGTSAKKAAVKLDYLNDIRAHVDAEVPQTISTALKAFDSLFTFEETAHKYILKKDPSIAFKSVTTINAEHGYGIQDMAKLSEEIQAKIKESGKIGTATHNAAEEIITGVIKDVSDSKTIYKVSDDAKLRLRKIIEDIEKKKTVNGVKPILLSEVVVADISKGISGTIDLVVIDSLGAVHIYDFKTHKNGFKWYTSTKFKHSDQSTYRLQLSAYKLLLEEVLDGKVRVATMNIIQLVPEIDEKNKVIMTLALDTSMYSNGIDSFYITPLTLQKIYGTGRGYNWDSATQLASLDTDVLSTPGYKLEQIELGKISSLDEVYRKTMRMLESKVEIMKKRYSFTKRRSFEEHFNIVSQIDNTNEALLNIILYAAKVTNELVNRYNKLDAANAIFTPVMLEEWNDYIMAYDSLDSIQALITTDTKLLNDPAVKEALNKVIENKNKIKNIYTLKGKEAVAKRLVPYFDMIKIQRKEELESFWRKMEYKVKHKKPFKEGEKIGGKVVSDVMTPAEFEKYGKTVNEFVDYHLSKERHDIEKATYELLLKELSVASNDVNEATRWVDALVDTSDPIAAAIVSAFNKADEISRLESLDKKLEYYKVLTKLEVAKNKTGMTSEREFYDSILETTETESFLIRPFLSSLEKAEREVRDLHRDDDNGIAIHAWIEENFKLGKYEDAYLEAFRDYIISEYYNKRLNFKEANSIILNEVEPSRHFPYSVLAESQKDENGVFTGPPLITQEGAELAMNWKSKYRKQYSELNEKWVNPKWTAFMKQLNIPTNIPARDQFDLVAKSEDPMAQMYTLLVKSAQEADEGIPYSHRLGFRLPGVRKNTNENLREGKSVAASFKERVQLDFIRKEGDVQYNPQEYTDETGKPKYFLPVHYINRLTPVEQSFDLPTIYLKFWDSANDYFNKREILPTIEMAKKFVEVRVTQKRNSFGEKILRSVKSNIPGFENEPAVTTNNNLAAQLNDWFQMYVYGNTSERSELKINDNLTLDVQKLTDGINRYTSVNLLALNVVQGFANIGIGLTMQAIETIAGEYVDKKTYAKGAYRYSQYLPGILDDVGRRVPRSKGSLLIEQFNAMNESHIGETEFANKNKLKALARQNAFAFIQNGGEHLMRGRFLYAMLDKEIKAVDKDGNVLGNMIDFYYVKDGKLIIKDEVDLVNSKWTEEEQQLWGRRFRGISDRIHGAYSLEAKVAAQRYFIGKLAYMFRKFVVPGMRKRYGKKAYNEHLHQTVEGNYRTTYRFFKKMHSEIIGMKFALIGEEWAGLSTHEQANIKRTISEFATVTALIVLGSFAYSGLGERDDDDADGKFWAFMAYQIYRLKAEMLFFVNPSDSMQILRSPMASMSVLENIGKVWQQMFNPMEVYQRGPWKGQLKMKRNIIQFIPVYKQYFKLRDISEQVQWFR